MATTTNYGWTTPDDTALVKDGASAIRSLGTSVDTTTKNLNPSTTLGDIEYRSSTANTNTRLAIGTSGQGLQVVAGVPSWAASSTSTLTTTGDLLYASAANTLARRAIGTTGQVLTVSGGLPTWASPSGSNKSFSLLNAGGTSLTGATSITVSSLSGYDSLVVLISGGSTAGNSAIEMYVNNDTGNKYGYGGHYYNMNASYSSTLMSTVGAADGTGNRWTLVGTTGGSAALFAVSAVIQGANSTGGKSIQSMGATDTATGQHQWQQGVYLGSAVVSSLVFLSSSGNFDAGKVYVYGSVA